MYSNLRIFSFEGQNVRTVIIDCEPWFVVQDVCTVLGIKRACDVVRRTLRKSELRKEVIPTSFSRMGSVHEGTRKMLLTNESGIYTLIMRSNKEEAIGFRAWVTEEVLPTICRTGSYTMKDAPAQAQEPQAQDYTITLLPGETITLNLRIAIKIERYASGESAFQD